MPSRVKPLRSAGQKSSTGAGPLYRADQRRGHGRVPGDAQGLLCLPHPLLPQVAGGRGTVRRRLIATDGTCQRNRVVVDITLAHLAFRAASGDRNYFTGFDRAKTLWRSAESSKSSSDPPTRKRAGKTRPFLDAAVPCRRVKTRTQPNWFMVFSSPPALRAASPEKYSLWSSPMSEPAMFWCLTQAIPWRISWRCTLAT